MNRQNKHKTVKRRKIINKTVKNNSNTEIQSLRNTYGYVTIPKGMKVGQAVLCPVVQGKFVMIETVEKVEDKDRGNNGFGSTGII
jgi:dUTPase